MKSKKHHKNTINNNNNTWQCCEQRRRLNCKHCRKLDLWKVCNFILISCLVLVSLANGTDTLLGGCTSNPCVFGVCIDEINGWVTVVITWNLLFVTWGYFPEPIIVIALMVIRGSNVKRTGMNVGVHHAWMVEPVSMVLPCTIAHVPKALVVRITMHHAETFHHHHLLLLIIIFTICSLSFSFSLHSTVQV